MKQNKFVILIFLALTVNAFAQIDKTTFFNRVNSIYHNLEISEIENFKVQVTSDYFEFNAGEGIDHDAYSPIEFIWSKPRQLNFNRIPHPQIKDTAQQKIIFQLQNEMFHELRGIFMDWQRFLGGRILYDLPQEYYIDSVGDTVHIEFNSFENNQPIKMRFYFGQNAVCFKIETIYQSIKQKIVTYPSYILIDKKWLCTEWVVKIHENGEITSGFSVIFKSGKHTESWLPVQALIQVQTRQKLNQTFTRLYKFRNLQVNQDLVSSKN